MQSNNEIDLILQRGLEYLQGTNGSHPNYKSAFECFTKAAESDSAEALIKLAEMLSSGKGCRKDLILAAAKLEQAAKLGSAEGAYKLGYALMNGIGTKIDKTRGISLYELAASKGHAQAAYRAAHAYYYASAKTPIYIDAALKYYQKAISMGHYDAMISLADLHIIGTAVPKDINKAKELYESARKLDGDDEGIAADRLKNIKSLSSQLYDDRFPKP